MTENHAETEQKPLSSVSPTDQRKRLFQVLDGIISFSEEKRLLKGNSDRAKQSWTRIAVAAITSYGGLLKDSELEDIESRLTKLETASELQKWK